MSPFAVEKLRLRHPAFPARLNGFHILFLSDLHARAGARETALVRFLARHEYDLVLFGGDYQYGLGRVSAKRHAVIAAVVNAARARHGVFGCVGNHDSRALIDRLRREPLVIATNESFPILPGLRLAVAGDAWHDRDDFAASLGGAPGGEFVVGLTHSPDAAWRASAAGVSLMICGHTHGGQVRLPLLGSPVKRVRRDRRLFRGNFRLDRMLLHISPGFGTSLLPIRYGVNASVTEITLEHGALHHNRFRRVLPPR